MRFGREYYQRYYFDPRTAVATRREMQARARLIAALTGHVGLPVRRILEAGCGTGMLRTPLRRLLPRAHYVGLEHSDYLCRRYGWQRGRIDRQLEFDFLRRRRGGVHVSRFSAPRIARPARCARRDRRPDRHCPKHWSSPARRRC